MSAEGQSAGPATSATPALPQGLVFADTYSRFAAYFLDGILLSILASLPPAILGLYDYSTAFPPEPMPRATYLGVSIFTLAVQAAYFLWFWTGGRRATPGQRVFGIQVGNAFDGEPLTMAQAITRWLAMGWWLSLLPLLPFFAVAVASFAIQAVWIVIVGISMIFSPTKQGIHDRIARSALVRPAGPTSRWAIGCVWLLVILVVIEALALILLSSVVTTLQDYYPPGTNPFEVLERQIREVWPN